ncbi:MAG: hypothetical protein H7321_01635 [Bacteroidia bacterium]|nr:hypothetical protein [Bacteroidia bacterium]
MHKHTLEELLKWLYVWLMLLYYRAENKPVIIVAALCLIYIAIINISFEPVPYLAIMTIAFSWVFTRKIFTPLNLLLAAMPILGFSIHLYQNFHHFGSWTKVFEDMNHAAADRVKGVAKGELHRALTFKEYLEIPFLWFNRMERFYLIPGWSFLVLMLLGLKRVKRENLQTFRIFLALAFCSVCWSFLMSQHYYIHTFTSRHWGLFFGLIIGYGLFEYRRLLLQTWKTSGIAMKVFHVIFIGYTVAMALSQQVWDLYIRYGFGYLYFEDKL